MSARSDGRAAARDAAIAVGLKKLVECSKRVALSSDSSTKFFEIAKQSNHGVMQQFRRAKNRSFYAQAALCECVTLNVYVQYRCLSAALLPCLTILSLLQFGQ